ncbi:MAG: aminotransferase class IV [Planctomycetes bacterium]|nr:aminotransferase class IV [Planctomycetota bacterium]
MRASPPEHLLSHKTSERTYYDRARREAAPFEDALLVLPGGEILETTIANLFLVREGRLVTPESALPLLAGIARAASSARRAPWAWKWRRGDRSSKRVASIEGAFLTNALFPVEPVAEIEGFGPLGGLSGLVRDLWGEVAARASGPV